MNAAFWDHVSLALLEEPRDATPAVALLAELKDEVLQLMAQHGGGEP